MRVLYVSKASAVPAYQDKLRSLAERVELHALLPARWGTATTHAPGDLRVTLSSAILHGHNHFHVYPDAAAVLTRVRPDVVHIDEEPFSAAAFQFARLCSGARIPFLFFAWQNIFKTLPPPFGMFRRYVFQHAAAAIAGTRGAALVLREGGWRGIEAIIPQLGVNTARFRRDEAAWRGTRAQLGIPSEAFVAGFAGRLVPEKGVDLLIDAVACVADTQMHCVIIGDGPERERLRGHAERAGIAGRVHFAGAVDSLEMPRWLNALDTLVLPSRTTRRWSEQFGRVLTEAMSCGVAVIGADSGEIAHVVSTAGLTFAEGDVSGLAAHLSALCGSPALRAGLAAAGEARVAEHFTQERVAGDTLALYERVVSRATLPAARTAVNAVQP